MADRSKLTKTALAQKVRWEGGLWAALEYGILPEDIDDPELAQLWRQLADGYRRIAPLVAEATTRLGVAA